MNMTDSEKKFKEIGKHLNKLVLNGVVIHCDKRQRALILRKNRVGLSLLGSVDVVSDLYEVRYK